MKTKKLSQFVNDYVSYRASHVKIEKYEIKSVTKFALYADKNKIYNVTRKLVIDYLNLKKNPTRGHRFSLIKQIRPFCKFLNIQNSNHFVPEYGFAPRPKSSIVPFIFNDIQVSNMMSYARNKLWKGPQRLLVPATYETLIGLLWTTGMRISEAKNLNIGDINFEDGIVHIRETKFYKSRLLPLKKSTTVALKNYLAERNSFKYPSSADSPFFFNWAERQSKRGRYTVDGFHDQLRKIIIALDFRNEKGLHARPYDLRHSFATSRLNSIYEQDRPLEKLPIIANYLGHAKFSHTQVYLHPSISLLEKLGKTFFEYFKAGI